MEVEAFELGENLNNRIVGYRLYKPLWEKFNLPGFNLEFKNWQSIKYLNQNGDNFGDGIKKVPSNCGGIYLFYIKCNIISGITEYPLYIGRAQFTKNQNLRKRVKEYYQHFCKNEERPKITRMFKYWAKELHLAYFILDNNANVVDLERQLINSLLFPMNDEIPEQRTKNAIKAFK